MFTMPAELKRNRLQQVLYILAGLFFVAAFIVYLFAKPEMQVDHLSTSQLLERANSAYVVGDFKTALSFLKVAAQQGNARAEYSLGYMYQHGEGVEADIDIAKSWYKKAAEQGHTKAKAALKKIK